MSFLFGLKLVIMLCISLFDQKKRSGSVNCNLFKRTLQGAFLISHFDLLLLKNGKIKARRLMFSRLNEI